MMLEDGTSASAPAVASMIALLNAEQMRRGEPPLGFVNPWLYQLQQLASDNFVDVTWGDTASTEDLQCKYGFSAKPGWDPASGLGIPRFRKLLENLPRRPPSSTGSKPASDVLAGSQA